MALIIDHDAFSRNVGTRNWGPVTVPDGLTTVTLRLARRTAATPTLWAAGVGVKLDSWCSVDGGVTWLQWLGFTGVGGILLRGDGTEIPESWCSSDLPEGVNRQMKLTLVVTGARLTTELTVEAV